MSEEKNENVRPLMIEGQLIPHDPHSAVAQLKAEPNESPESFAKRRYEKFYEIIRENNKALREGAPIGPPFDLLPGKIKKEWIEGARKFLDRTQSSNNPYARKIVTRAEAIRNKRGLRRPVR